MSALIISDLGMVTITHNGLCIESWPKRVPISGWIYSKWFKFQLI